MFTSGIHSPCSNEDCVCTSRWVVLHRLFLSAWQSNVSRTQSTDAVLAMYDWFASTSSSCNVSYQVFYHFHHALFRCKPFAFINLLCMVSHFQHILYKPFIAWVFKCQGFFFSRRLEVDWFAYSNPTQFIWTGASPVFFQLDQFVDSGCYEYSQSGYSNLRVSGLG